MVNLRMYSIIVRLNVMVLEFRGTIDALDQVEVEILCFGEAYFNK